MAINFGGFERLGELHKHKDLGVNKVERKKKLVIYYIIQAAFGSEIFLL